MKGENTMKSISTNNAPQAIGPYSQGMIVSPFLFISGQIPLTPEGILVEGGIKEQTEQVMKNLYGILSSQGLHFNNVAKTTIFLGDMNDFAIVNEIYESYMKEHKPARSTVEVSKLPKNVKIEIEAIAFIE